MFSNDYAKEPMIDKCLEQKILLESLSCEHPAQKRMQAQLLNNWYKRMQDYGFRADYWI